MTIPTTESTKYLYDNNLVKFPLNYVGGKYKLLKQILPLFPKDIKNFVDLFAGGCNVGVNVEAENIYANDCNHVLIDILEYLKENDIKTIENHIFDTIKKYKLSNSSKFGYAFYDTTSQVGLGKYNKEQYLKLRAEYNKKHNIQLLLVLIIFSFNNFIRFNSKGEFNLPVNKRDFTKNMQENLRKFSKRLKEINIKFSKLDFKNFIPQKEAFVYIDPPYLISTAVYNETNGWTKQHEANLLSYLNKLDSQGLKFALSNVLENKGNINTLLKEWTKKHNHTIHELNYSYTNCSYTRKTNNLHPTREVLITNY